jgi:hypothetical protein
MLMEVVTGRDGVFADGEARRATLIGGAMISSPRAWYFRIDGGADRPARTRRTRCKGGRPFITIYRGSSQRRGGGDPMPHVPGPGLHSRARARW